MKSKGYPSRKPRSKIEESMVKEGDSSVYARQKPRKPSLRIGITLAEAKKRVARPLKRSEKDIKWALGIVGIGEGPEDLSENMRAYLRREK